MEKDFLTVNEQASIAAKIVNGLFVDFNPPIPEGATLESLWALVCAKQKLGKRPKKVDAVKLLLEDERLTGLSIPLLADIIKKVFGKYHLACNTSDSSIRWYISQKTLEWDIKPRTKFTPQ